MLSSLNKFNPFTLTPSFRPRPRPRPTKISSLLFPGAKRPPPPSSPPDELYQPFRPPPSPLPPKFRNLGPLERLDILRDRLGLWHEYAPLVSALFNDSFTPASIEEVTGITGVEQNRLVVAAQVRDSLLSAPLDEFDPDDIPFFDPISGAELLYELRFLNASQRAKAAAYVIDRSLDGRDARELARAMKDFPRRRGDDGWDCFSAVSPGDCLAYTYFRRSREVLSPEERLEALERAAATAATEEARARIGLEVDKATGKAGEDRESVVRVTVPVVRLKYGEVAEASSVVVLPVCRAGDGAEGIAAAPEWCRPEGELGVVGAEKGWSRWAVLPGWAAVMGAAAKGGAVAVEFGDGRVLPWARRGERESVLVVVDRSRRKTKVEAEREEGEEENLERVVAGYFVVGTEDGLKIDRGSVLAEKGVTETVGMVVLVVRPPRDDEDDDILSDEDWD